jgi:uncharacterized protein
MTAPNQSETGSLAGSKNIVEQALDHAVHYLPGQGPITVFIHHNTLHAFEHLPFIEAVRQASSHFNCRALLPESWYRQAWTNAEFSNEDLEDALLESLGEQAETFVGFLGTRFSLWREMLYQPLQAVLPNELEWVFAENRSLERFDRNVPAEAKRRLINDTKRWVLALLASVNAPPHHHTPHTDLELLRFRKKCESLGRDFQLEHCEAWNDATWEAFTLHLLWQVCFHAVSRHPHVAALKPPVRHRDAFYELTGVDSDQLVHELLIRFCVVFIDQGMSPSPLPCRQQGFLQAFIAIYGHPNPLLPSWLIPLADELAALANDELSPLQSIANNLHAMGVSTEEIEKCVTHSLLAIRGFAGMIWQMETRPDRVTRAVPPGTLTEFLAVRLILDKLALNWLMHRELGSDVGFHDLKDRYRNHSEYRVADQVRSEAFSIFQLAQGRGWRPETLFGLTPANWRKLLTEIRAFDETQRCYVFQLALERRWRHECFDAVQAIHQRNQSHPIVDSLDSNLHSENVSDSSVAFDVITCIDEREESFRRHLEEVEPRVRTWGAAGFFSVAMYYQAADSFQAIPLCPIVIEPQHLVTERVCEELHEVGQERAGRRRRFAEWLHGLHLGSRSLLSGAVTSIAGVVAAIPLVLRVLFPRIAGVLRNRFDDWMATPHKTELELELPANETDNHHRGFTFAEMANIVERLLTDIGLVENWSPLVIVVGHGSSSLNNPHGSAYNCGACGGGHGGPNARAFAKMANDERVRSVLAERALEIPATTWFVGGYHNTGSDQVSFLDESSVPDGFRSALATAREAMVQVSQRNAHERCRRFVSAPLNLSPAEAYKHVLTRIEDLSQARPECGHATNAICIVGRRERTRGLYLDRRAFLHSYDPGCDDDDATILSRILAAVVPVCAGINLEYFFSYTDPVQLGCSTKLPHNITSLLGVMDGAQSDLRTGLPWQMVEIHKPLRLLLLIETTTKRIEKILKSNPGFARLVENDWLQLALMSPDSAEVLRYVQDSFIPYGTSTGTCPRAKTSWDWYHGNREDLGFAMIDISCAPVGVKAYPKRGQTLSGETTKKSKSGPASKGSDHF